jgi:NAD(P)-dependent dehydrogenase (short-subunit alcohol dehydrogenase family)
MRAMADRPPAAVVFGARNTGRAIVAERLAAGWGALAVARTDATLRALEEAHPGALTLRGDAADTAVVRAAVARAEDEIGPVRLVVNAVTAAPRGGPFGGGPVVRAPEDAIDAWLAGFVPMAWSVLRVAGEELARRGRGTLVQVVGGSARRPIPGRAMWGAAQHAARALTLGLAQELRPEGVHVALLVADGVIETERRPLGDDPPDAVLDSAGIAAAVGYLASQGPRGWTHEMAVTPRLEPWTP